ncbi:hypothetical protein JXQ31_18730 [candidate division KSB1 bacterium]|nr:hypothetical protein [candidate division KSB1 bacterium]
MDTHIRNWLLEGDPAIRWQTLRDLMGTEPETVRNERHKVADRGWGAKLLALQDDSGMWGGGIYSPKWISTTYTMLLLRRLGLEPKHPRALRACQLLLDKGFYRDGGINYFAVLDHSETCVTGMVLSIVAYFQYEDKRINSLVEHLLSQQMPDGGWNCQSYYGAVHGSFHTTINVLEGLYEFERYSGLEKTGVQSAINHAVEFLLRHKLYKSDRTGKIINPNMTRFSFPPRWYYDVLRALDYFQASKRPYDPRLSDALELVHKKRLKDGAWPLQNRHPGRTFFEMEEPGKPSRWNTLRALRILKWAEEKF